MALNTNFDGDDGYVHIGRHKMTAEEAVNYAIEIIDTAAAGEYGSALFAYAQAEMGYTERDAKRLVNRFLQWKNRRLTERISGAAG